jgi:hypothetical protein
MSNDATVQRSVIRDRAERLRPRARREASPVSGAGGGAHVSRRAFWIRGSVVALIVLALLGFTLHSLRLSDASFAATSANQANIFVGGTLSHVNDRDGQVMLTASGLEPGMRSTGTMTLTGTGNVTGAYELTLAGLMDVPASPALSETLYLTLEDVTGAPTTLWEGAVSDFDARTLGTIAPGVTRSYRLTLEYPDGPDDARLQGASMTLRLKVAGVSS